MGSTEQPTTKDTPTMTDYTFKICTIDMTVYAVDEHREHHDLNAGGEPCETLDDLRALVDELCEQGSFSPETRDRLLSEI